MTFPPDPAPPPDAAPDPTPTVPGFDLRRLLGRGAHAEVWLATDLATGSSVALKIAAAEQGVPGARADGADEEGLAALAREVALLRRIDHPHIVRLLRVVGVTGGGLAAVLEHAPGGSLADLVAARSRLEPAEVTTLLVPLGRALAHLHERGLVHGDLSPGNVLFAADGRPMLADLGVARVLGLRAGDAWGTPGFVDPAHPRPDPAGDVRALGALGWYALTGSPPGDAGDASAGGAGDAGMAPPRLVRLLRSCLARDHSERPSAAEVVREAWAAVPPAPIRLLAWVGRRPDDHPDLDPDAGAGGGARTPGAVDVTRRVRAAATPVPAGPGRSPASRDRRRWPRRNSRRPAGVHGAASGRSPVHRWARLTRAAAMILAVAMLAVLGVAVGRWWPPADHDRVPGVAGADTGGPADPAADLRGVVQRLAGERALAFATASVTPLRAVDEPNSVAMAADTALVGRLLGRGIHLEGLGFLVGEVREVARGPGTITVSAVVATSAHRQVHGDRTVVARVPAGASRTVRLVLVRGDRAPAGWWVRAVEPFR